MHSQSRWLFFTKIAGFFDDVILASYLVPRFEPFFINEARQALLKGSPDLDAKLTILRNYKTYLSGRASIPARHRRKVEMIARLLDMKSPALVRVAGRVFSD